MGFAVTDSATGLKLIEAGVPKETLAMLAVPMIPLQITLPWIVSRYTSGNDDTIFSNQAQTNHWSKHIDPRLPTIPHMNFDIIVDH
jgi:hypothetical protein